MLRLIVTVLLAAVASSPAAGQTDAVRPPHVFIASDSTAQTYRPDRAPQAGWGQMLPCSLDQRVTVENRAIGGRSTKSFMVEGRLDRIAQDIRAGDTLLIQFAHNDANTRRPERFAAADTDYRLNLLQFIRVATAVGAHPVLLTPVTRRSFEGTRVVPSFAAYSKVVREVAQQTGTPLIDLETLSGAWVQAAGPEKSKAYFLHLTPADNAPGYPKGVTDDTHFSQAGAQGVAGIIATQLRALRLPVSAHVLAQPRTEAACAL